MKPVIYLLVLANAAFLLWEVGFAGRGESSGPLPNQLAMPSGVEPIRLIGEPGLVPDAETVVAVAPPAEPTATLAAADRGEKAAVEAKDTKSSKPVDCFQLGPSQTQDQAQTVADLFKSHAKDVSVVAHPGDVPNGWWVLYPKAENLDAARKNRQMLSEKGIADAWLFDKGPLQWAISLGLHNTREKAEEAQKPLTAKNIVTEIAPRMVRGRVYWVKIPWRKSALDFDEVVQVLNSQDPTLSLPAPRPCE
jgi:hypothetical protein